MSTTWQDTFSGRTVSSNNTGSWGVASDGVNTWVAEAGTGGNNTFVVSSGEGQLSEASGTGIIIMRCGSVTTATDVEVSCRMSPGTASDSVHLFARTVDSTHYYRLDMQVGGTSLVIGGKNGGSFFSIATSANVGFTMATGTFYWMRFRVIGTSLYGKIWQDGNSEPTTWNISTTDATIASGGVGVGANPQGTAACQFDTFNAFTIDVSLSDANTFSDTPTITATPKPVDSNSFADSMTKTGAPTFSDSLTSSDTQLNTASSTKTTDAESTTDTYTDTAVFTRANSIDNNNAYQSTILADTPIIYYRLSDIAGTVAHDSSGNKQDGTIGSGVTLGQPGGITGDADNAMSFSGSGTSQITIPQTNLPTGSSQWSVECWCMRPSFPASGQYNFALGFGTYGAPNHQMASIGIHWSSSTVGHSILGTYSGDIEGSAIAPGVWYHIVGTFDGTNINLYTNGFLTAHTAEVPNIIVAFANVGAGSNADRFVGSIDEAAIYNYALTPTQVLAHYNAGANFTYESIAVTEAQTLTDSNSAVEATTSTSSSAIIETSLSSSDSFTDTSAVSGVNLNNSYKNVVLNDSPLSYYRLDESSGTTVFDATVNARNGTIHGSVSLSQVGALTGIGDADSSMYFDGTTSYITLPQTNLPTGGNLWSIEAWAMISSYPTNGHKGCLVGFGTYASHEMAVLFVNGTSGGTSAQSYLSTFGGDLGGPTMVLGNWYHIVATFDGTKINIYQNGSLFSSTTETPNIVLNFASIGASNTGPQDYANGYVDEVAMYNYALTPTQILAHYNAGTKGASASYESYTATISETSTDMITFDDGAFSDTSVAKPFDAGSLTDAINDASASTVTDSSSVTDTSSNTSNTTRTHALSLLDAMTDTVAENIVDSGSIVESSTIAGTPKLNDTSSFQNETITLAETEALVDAYSLDDSKTNLQLSETQSDTPAPLTEASTTNTAFTDGIMQWSDTFSGRTVATNTSGDWGQASNGEFWSCLQGIGSSTVLAVANNEGTINQTSGNGIVIMRLGQKSAADTEVLCRISPGVANDSIYVFTRLIDNIHYYRMDFTGSNLQIAKKAGGGFTSIISSNSGITSTPGVFYWLRFRVVGTALFGKVWIDGTQEPISWLVTATDTSNAVGGVGCGCNPQSSTNVQFDSFSAYTVIPADATFVDFITFAENVSLTDPYQFLDNIFLVDVNSTKLLFTMTTCRSGSVTASSRGN